eukprot:Em0002g507a
MEADQENDEFEDAKLIEDVVFYLREKTYRVDCTKNWKRSIRRKAEKFETRDCTERKMEAWKSATESLLLATKIQLLDIWERKDNYLA